MFFILEKLNDNFIFRTLKKGVKVKIAYCILCHKYNKILRTCVDLLKDNNEDVEIYIHVDKKSNIKEFSNLKGKVNFIEERKEVYWGHISQVKATLALLRETQKKNYDYIFLISGDDLPLKSNREIKEFLAQNNGKEFITVQECEERIFNQRLRRISILSTIKRNKNYFEKIKAKIIRRMNKILRNENKYLDKLPKIYFGSSWFTITSDFRDYIFEYLEKNKEYMKAFEYSKCGDELFFQSIIMDSQFKNNIYKSNLRYIDWTTGPDFPKILCEEDYNKILKSDCLFGRKFSDVLDLIKFKQIFHRE